MNGTFSSNISRILCVFVVCSWMVILPTVGSAKDDQDLGKTEVQTELLRHVKEKAKNEASGLVGKSEERPRGQEEGRPFELVETAPDNISALLESVSEKNSAIIAEFKVLLHKDPLNPSAPEWLFRVAELEWQTAHYQYLKSRRQWLSGLEACEASGGGCPEEPTPRYDSAIEYYRQILAQYPSFNRNDEVLFKLGDGLIRNKREKEGISYLHKLTQAYPSYKGLDAAYLSLGEYYFSQKNTGTAQAAYQKLIDAYPTSAFYNYAQYKLAWTYLNLADEEAYLEAIRLFKRVIETIDAQYAQSVDANGQIDENQLKTGEVSFRNQAINDLSSTYAELPQGWQQAKNYLENHLPPEKVREKLEQLAVVLDNRGKFEEEIELYSNLIASNALHPQLPVYAQNIINAYNNANLPENALEATRRFIHTFLPSKEWYRHNAQSHEKEAIRGVTFSEKHLYTLATQSILKANEDKIAVDAKMQLFEQAKEDLYLFNTEFSSSKQIYDTTFYYAYVLDELSDAKLEQIKKMHSKHPEVFRQKAQELIPELVGAAEQYQKTIDLRVTLPQDQGEEHTQVSANRQVFVYANILATEDPQWSIENSAKTKYFKEEKRDSAKLPPEPLTKAEENFAHSAQQFAKLFPLDDDTPAFLWRTAEIYRAKNHYNDSAQQFDSIISNFPQHQYAAVSVGSMFELYNKAQNWQKIEYWAQWLLDKENFKYYSAKELEDAIAFSVDHQADALTQVNPTEACVKLLSLEARFPHRQDLFDPAILKSADLYEKHSLLREATETYNHYTHLANPMAESFAHFKQAQIRVKLTQYDKAAMSFEKVATQEAQAIRENRANEDQRLRFVLSTIYSAQLYAALEQKAESIKIFQQYLDLNLTQTLDLYQIAEETKFSTVTIPDGVPLLTQTNALFRLAEWQEDEAAIATLKILTKHTDPYTANHAKVLQAQREFNNDNLKNAKNLVDGLIKQPSNMTSQDFVLVSFLQAELQYKDFQSITLEFPIRTLRKRIEQKAKSRQKAEELYKNVIQLKNAYYSTGAALRMAQMALEFRDAFKALPIPEELENNPEERENYILWLEDELIFPAEDAATSLLNYAQSITLELHSYTPWSLEVADELAKLQPNNYPIKNSTIIP